MNKSTPQRGQSDLFPGKGARVALLTKDGLITGALASWSHDGAVVEASAEVQAGTQVLLRVQGTDQIWQRKATVLWVNKGQGFGLEFEPENPIKKSWLARMIARVLPYLYASPARAADGTRSASKSKKESRTNKRRARRFQIESPAQVVTFDAASVDPDLATVTETSSSGVLFITDRDYSVGTELQIQYLFPSSVSSKQGGKVVRVEKLSDGRRRVALVFK